MPRASKLAAKLSIRQIEGLHHADALGDATDRVMADWWKRLLSALKQRSPGLMPDVLDLRSLFAELPIRLRNVVAGGLAQLVYWGHDSAVEPLRHALPARFIKAVALREDQEPPSGKLEVPSLPEPAENMSKADLWRAFKTMMFPPPTIQETSEIVHSGNWRERLAATSRLASPSVLAQAVAQGTSQGENIQQLAKRLLPQLEGVRTSARRVARTEGMRVAHESQMRAWDKLGDTCVGFQIHATLDQHTRPWHAKRSGTIYYKQPTEGQKGPYQMPRPPIEADDPNERPAGTPHTAYNCRCYLTPVLQPAKRITDDAEKTAIFTTAEDKLVPDPAVYSEWFERASPALRKKAVGVRRYNTVEKQLGEPPSWAHFLDPESGDLLPTETLKTEPEEKRSERVAEVDAAIAQNRELTREVSAFGFVRPPPTPPTSPTAGSLLPFMPAAFDPVMARAALVDAVPRLGEAARTQLFRLLRVRKLSTALARLEDMGAEELAELLRREELPEEVRQLFSRLAG